MPTATLLAVGGVFVAVALLTGAIATIVMTRSTAAERRLRQVTKLPPVTVIPELLPLQSDQMDAGWNDAAKWFGKSKKEIAKIRLRLLRAGIKRTEAPVLYAASEYLAPVILAALPFLLLGGNLRWPATGLGAIIGFFGPGLIVERMIRKRQREIENGLPDALDLLVVCVEAGSGLDQAIVKASDELSLAYPVLGEELKQVTSEIRAGKPRLEAFKHLAQRTKVDDVRGLVAMLVQTDRFGTSIGQALRTHSEIARSKRRQRAEEAAQKIGVKLVFPLVLCFFPAFYVIVLGPAVIQFLRTLGS